MKWKSLIILVLGVILISSCNNRTVIYYSGSNDEKWKDYSIGIAIKDGDEIIKYENNPVLVNGELYDYTMAKDSFVLEIGDRLFMYYSGHNSVDCHTIDLAESNDGVNWIKYEGNPIMKGDGYGWDAKQVCRPSIYDTKKNGDKRYRMLYTGQSELGIWSIGYAYSANGYEWISSEEPVISIENSDEWDNTIITSPSNIVKRSNLYHVYYSGYNPKYGWQIGLVTFEDFEGEYIKSEYNPVLSPRKDAKQTILNILSSDTFEIKDSEVFNNGELVFICDKESKGFELNRIYDNREGIIVLEKDLKMEYSAGSTIRSWMNRSVAWCDVRYNNKWEMLFTAFQALYEDTGKDRRIVSYAYSDDGINWVIDYAKSPYIPYEEIEGSWDELMISDGRIAELDNKLVKVIINESDEP